MLVGVAIGSDPIFAPGLDVFWAGVLLAMVSMGLESRAARRVGDGVDVDSALLSALIWRHVAEAWPVRWRSR